MISLIDNRILSNKDELYCEDDLNKEYDLIEEELNPGSGWSSIYGWREEWVGCVRRGPVVKTTLFEPLLIILIVSNALISYHNNILNNIFLYLCFFATTDILEH